MWKSKRFIIVAVVAAVIVVGTVAGVALAQDSDDSTSSPAKSFAGRVAAILGIEQQKVEDAFAQAKREMADDALNAKLDAMVESGKIDQQQADEYRNWWGARPQDMPQIGPKGRIGPGCFGGRMAWPRFPAPGLPVQ